MKKEVLKDNIQHDYLLIKLKTTKIKNILSYQGKQGHKEYWVYDYLKWGEEGIE